MSFHEVSYGVYYDLVWKMVYAILDERGVETCANISPSETLKREAVDRLYVLGCFHDLMIRWPAQEKAHV